MHRSTYHSHTHSPAYSLMHVRPYKSSYFTAIFLYIYTYNNISLQETFPFLQAFCITNNKTKQSINLNLTEKQTQKKTKS